MNRCALIGIALTALVTSGCATIFKGPQDRVTLQTTPPGAYAWVDGVYAGQTPVALRLDAASDHTVFFRLPGYQDATVQMEHVLGAGWIVLDVLAGIWPIVIDAITGAWNHLEGVAVPLQPGGAASEAWQPPETTEGPCPPGFTNDSAPGEMPLCVHAGGETGPPQPQTPPDQIMRPMD